MTECIAKRDLSKITMIIMHCSASDRQEDDDISVIRKWHLARGFSDVGYHYFVKKNGTVQRGRQDNEIGAHCKGFNTHSLGICLHGLKDFRYDQFYSVNILLRSLMMTYHLTEKLVYPHHFFNPAKACPVYDLHEIWTMDPPF